MVSKHHTARGGQTCEIPQRKSEPRAQSFFLPAPCWSDSPLACVSRHQCVLFKAAWSQCTACCVCLISDGRSSSGWVVTTLPHSSCGRKQTEKLWVQRRSLLSVWKHLLRTAFISWPEIWSASFSVSLSFLCNALTVSLKTLQSSDTEAEATLFI